MSSDDATQAAKDLLAKTNNNLEEAIAALQLSYTTKKTVVKNDGPVLVDVQNIAKSYKVGSQKIEALKGVSLQVRQGEFVALTGTSGSGKSTLLQLIGGLDRPTSGSIVVDDKHIMKLSDGKLSHFRNKTIGFVFQFFYLQPFLDLATNVQVPAMFAHVKRKDRQGHTDDMLDAVGLTDRAKHLPRELSGGQMQRAAIARALMNRPKLLLADEPTGNLDSTNAATIFALFQKLRDSYGTTVIVVTHDQVLASYADRVVTLRDGAIV